MSRLLTFSSMVAGSVCSVVFLNTNPAVAMAICIGAATALILVGKDSKP